MVYLRKGGIFFTKKCYEKGTSRVSSLVVWNIEKLRRISLSFFWDSFRQISISFFGRQMALGAERSLSRIFFWTKIVSCIVTDLVIQALLFFTWSETPRSKRASSCCCSSSSSCCYVVLLSPWPSDDNFC